MSENNQQARLLTPEELNQIVDKTLLAHYNAREELDAADKTIKQWLKTFRDGYVQMLSRVKELETENASLKEQLEKVREEEPVTVEG